MAFAWDAIYYPTRLAYEQALLPFAKPNWIQRVVIHHTYKPTVDQWRGQRSMDALERFYRLKGWPSGPHLFVAPDGLWSGTPLALQGTHAGICNANSIGVEIVGDYDSAPWPAQLRERIYQLLVLFLHWIGTTEAAIRGHRECLPNKSCPGRAIGMDLVRSEIKDRLFDRRFVVSVRAANVRMYPRTNSLILGRAPLGTALMGHQVVGAPVERDTRWARVRLASGAVGHIWAGLGRWELP